MKQKKIQNISCTSQEQQWHKPRGKIITSDPVMRCVFPKASTDQNGRIKSPVKAKVFEARSSEELHNFKEDEFSVLKSNLGSDTPFSYLTNSHQFDLNATNSILTPMGLVNMGSPLSYQFKDWNDLDNATEFEVLIYNIQKTDYTINIQSKVLFPNLPIHILPNIIRPELVANLKEDENDLLLDLSIDINEARILQKNTIDQSKNPLWVNARKKRLTASNFGNVIIRKSKPSESFLKNIFKSNDLSNVRAINYGKTNELKARQIYINKIKSTLNRDLMVEDAGLVVNPGLPFLGATPDGKVFDKYEKNSDTFGIIEIKCPYKYRDCNIKEAALNKDFCLEIKKDTDEIMLKKKHIYFYQVQGQMALSGIKWCDFIVYTSRSIFIQRINFDKNAWENIICPKLIEFYYCHGLPYLTK